MELQYATSMDSSKAPTTGWTTAYPEKTDEYIWTRTIVYYTDKTSSVSSSYCDTNIARLNESLQKEGQAIVDSLEKTGFVRIFEDRIYLLDNKDPFQVKQAICMNNKGIAFAKASGNQSLPWNAETNTFGEEIEGSNVFTAVWGIEGTFDLRSMNVINIKAENIQDGTLTLGKDKNQNGHLEIYGINEETPTVLADGEGIRVALNNGGEASFSETDGLKVTSGSNANKEYGSYSDGKGFEANNLRANNELVFGKVLMAKPMSIKDTSTNIVHTGVAFIKIV